MMINKLFSATTKALLRYRAVTYVELLRDRNYRLEEALTEASKRPWPDSQGRMYGRSTIQAWWYSYAKQGFSACIPRKRSDSGSIRALKEDECLFVSQLAAEQPDLSVKEIHERLCSRTKARSDLPSYSSVHRYLNAQGLDRSVRAKLRVVRSNRTKEEDELWMLTVLQGQMSVSHLASELGACGDTEQLYWCVTNSPLRYRNRALAILSHKKGISKTSIERFLKVGPNYVDRVTSNYQQKGLNWVSKDRRKGPKKFKQERYKEAVFATLHSPPSAHGINRTTWRTQDIKRVMEQQGLTICTSGIRKIIRDAGYTMRKAKIVLTSNDPDYDQKIKEITNTLRNLKSDEKFFSVDEFGPFAVKRQGGRSLMKRGQSKTVQKYQKSKGSLIVTAALELSENQVTHFYSENKNTNEMLKLLEVLLEKYMSQSCLYFSWDAASWHASKKLYMRVEEINSPEYRAVHKSPIVRLKPLPSRAQFLNVIESVFSGMAKAIIHNSDYQSVDECKTAIDRHFEERNQHFKAHPKRAGGRIWCKELVPSMFNEANNCKNPRYR